MQHRLDLAIGRDNNGFLLNLASDADVVIAEPSVFHRGRLRGLALSGFVGPVMLGTVRIVWLRSA